jgi:hypothetical protein
MCTEFFLAFLVHSVHILSMILKNSVHKLHYCCRNIPYRMNDSSCARRAHAPQISLSLSPYFLSNLIGETYSSREGSSRAII